MSLKAALVEKAASLIDDKSEGWLDKALDGGEGAVETWTKDLAKEDQEEARKIGAEAATILRDGKVHLLRLGTLGFAKVTSYLLEEGDENKARLHYLEHEATFAERRAAMHAATDGLIDQAAADQAAWDAAKEVLKQVAGVALPFLIKLAAGAVGVPL